MNEQDLDQVLNEMRGEDVPPEVLAAAQERVWNQIHGHASCTQFQQQFSDYRRAELTEAKRLLLEDHLSRCATCRRMLAGAGERAVVASMPAPRPRTFRMMRRAIAAGVALVGIYAGRDHLDQWFAPGGPSATVQAASGGLYGIQGSVLQSGTTLANEETVRTGRGARAALQLSDGSTVEVNENTELYIRSAWSGQSIHLDRGDVIVHAAKQRRGSLRVITRDSVAVVKGTVFTVSTGMAGSVVGVVEGSVAVQQPGTQRLLQRGQQSASSPALAAITVHDTVAWSAKAPEYLALLGELAAIEKQLPTPASRTSSELLAVLPSNLMLYGALPNLGGTLEQAVTLIEKRSAESTVLREWWSSPKALPLKELASRVSTIAPSLGNEIVFALLRGTGGSGLPLLLAEVKPGQQATLQNGLNSLAQESGRRSFSYRIVGNLLVLANDDEQLTAAFPLLGQGGATPFKTEIASRYQRGVSLLIAADLPALTGNPDLRYAFFEQHTDRGTEQNEAMVTFPGQRTGIFSWLAAPAPAGSAEYVSSDAIVAFSAATRNPRQIVEDLLSSVNWKNPASEVLGELDKVAGAQISADIATSIGTDFTLAVETLALPDPGWFAALEVYRPELLNTSLRQLVNGYNTKLSKDTNATSALMLEEATENGRVWYTLRTSGNPFALHWTFDRGYVLLGSSRAQLLRSIATRAGGFQLIRSAKYRDQLPSSSDLHHSGFIWANVSDTLGAWATQAGKPELQQLFATREPALITFKGGPEQIAAASRTRISSLLFDLLLTKLPNDTRN